MNNMALKDYQWAAFAARNLKEDVGLAYVAMQKYYAEKGIIGDPIIQRAFVEAQTGLPSGQLTSPGLMLAIQGYTKNYETELLESKVSDIIKESGISMPKDAAPIMQKYGNMTYKAFIENTKKARAGEKENVSKLVKTIELAEDYKFEGVLKSNMLKENTEAMLSQIYQPEQQRVVA